MVITTKMSCLAVYPHSSCSCFFAFLQLPQMLNKPLMWHCLRSLYLFISESFVYRYGKFVSVLLLTEDCFQEYMRFTESKTQYSAVQNFQKPSNQYRTFFNRDFRKCVIRLLK